MNFKQLRSQNRLTYSKNKGRITVSPYLWAFHNNVYKYGKNLYRILSAFFVDSTNSASKEAGSWSYNHNNFYFTKAHCIIVQYDSIK